MSNQKPIIHRGSVLVIGTERLVVTQVRHADVQAVDTNGTSFTFPHKAIDKALVKNPQSATASP